MPLECAREISRSVGGAAIVEPGPPVASAADGADPRARGEDRDPTRSRWPRGLSVAAPTQAVQGGWCTWRAASEGSGGRAAAGPPRRTQARACESPRRGDLTSGRPRQTPELQASRMRAARTAALRALSTPTQATGTPGGIWAIESSASDRKSTRLNSSHLVISYAVFCLKKKKRRTRNRCHRAGRSD